MKKQLLFTVIFTASISPAIARQKVPGDLALDRIRSKTDTAFVPVSMG